VEEAEFVMHFNSSLSSDVAEFELEMTRFMEVATQVRNSKLEAKNRANTQQANHGDDLTHRKSELMRVFQEFDLDSSGEISHQELQKLGSARRALGQKSGTWTAEKNARLVARMDKDGDGSISAKEFVTHFAANLPEDRFDFAEVVAQFMSVAKECRKEKARRRDTLARKADADERRAQEINSAESSPRSSMSRDYDVPWPRGGLDDPVLEIRRRQTCLQHVFKQFDLDDSGRVEIDELQVLGIARQSLKHKARTWTLERNKALLRHIDVNRDGVIQLAEFITHFNEALPDDSRQFDRVIEQFIGCSSYVKQR